MYSKLQPSTPLYFLLSLAFLYSAAQSYQQICNHQDHSSLLAFYNTIQDSSPSVNWSTDTNCCQWEGVDCDNNGRVTHLQLSSRGILGVITSSIGNLVYLSHLNLSKNALSGPLPNGLFGLMESLEVIDLSSNHLSGNFSPSLSFRGSFPMQVHTIDISNNQFQENVGNGWFLGMKVLTSFNCSNNKFLGPLPCSICLSSPFLKTLDLSNNLFGGTTFDEIGECSHLEVFRAGFNLLLGSIPSSIFKLRKLQEISIPGNGLHGPLEVGIVRLSNLRIMDFSSNSISGSIPEKIGKLLLLEKLYLFDNNLTGPIPLSLMRCTNLSEIILRNNYLDGEISKLDWSGFTQLQKLDLLNNSLNGSLPESIYSCKSLIALRVSVNNFSGQISPKIVELRSLSFLALSSNSFSNITKMLSYLGDCQSLTTLSLAENFHGEVLPSEKSFLSSTSFPKIKFFSLAVCDLTGFFPEWLSHLKTLQVLSLNNNQITGKIPNWIGSFPTLFSLSLQKNNLFGEIPHELCWLPAMQASQNTNTKLYQYHSELPLYLIHADRQTTAIITSLNSMLNLQSNKLSGDIPLEIGNLQGLSWLCLANNYFSGHIPLSVSNLKILEMLDLSENSLSGELPASLKGLHFLAEFNVSYNDLQGPIPIGGQFDTFDESSFEGNPSLCGEPLHRPCSNTPTRSNERHLPRQSGSDSKRLFLNGLFVGFASGFSGVLAIVASYFWFNMCMRCNHHIFKKTRGRSIRS